MADDDRVGAGVGDQGDALAGLGDLPHRQLALDLDGRRAPGGTSRRRGGCAGRTRGCSRRPRGRASGRPTAGCSARGTPRRPARPACRATSGRGSPPATCRCPRRGRAPRSTGAAVWRARSSGETRTSSKCWPGHRRRQRLGLAPPELGERRVDDVQPVAHPLRLGVTDQNQLHGVEATSTVRARERVVSRPDGPFRVPLPQRSRVDGRRVDGWPPLRRPADRRTRRRPQSGGSNGLAVAGMVCGIVAVVIAWVPVRRPCSA